MTIYSIKQVSILFGERKITSDFSLKEIPQQPAINIYNNQLEALPDGNHRIIQTITPATDYILSFASELLSEEVKNIYLGYILENKKELMVISHNDDGKIIGTYYATIKDFQPSGAISNGVGSDGTITFSLLPV